MDYEAALDEMYSGYMAKRALVAGRLDREFKDPEVILSIARRRGLLPPPNRLVKITGSKGKGTTSRLIAHYLRRLRASEDDIAIFVSPEEFEHTDRMAINGAPIDREEFVSHYRSLRDDLADAAARLSGGAYLSPFGIFALIALSWFQQRGVGWYVLEIGRGGAHDEVGVLRADHAVITSIFNEHAGHLGPSLCDIAREKVAVSRSTRSTVASVQSSHVLRQCGLWEQYPLEEEDDAPMRANLPHWLALDDRLARQTVRSMLGVEDADLLLIDISGVSKAWGTRARGQAEIVFDALINLDSLDCDWLNRTFGDERVLVLFSLPDDKDRERLTAFMDALPNTIALEVVLLGKRGYLSFDHAESRGTRVCGRLSYDDSAGFRDLLDHQIAKHGVRKVYCFGTHTYIRLVKTATNSAR